MTILIECFTALILFLTFIAILWYAWETRGMKEQIVKQNELSLRPFITLLLEGNEYYLKNINRNPAIQIKMDNISLQIVKEMTFLSFDCIDVLSPDEKKILVIRNSRGETADAFDTGFIWQNSAITDHDFVIRYMNVKHEEYITFGTLGKSGIIINGTRKA